MKSCCLHSVLWACMCVCVCVYACVCAAGSHCALIQWKESHLHSVLVVRGSLGIDSHSVPCCSRAPGGKWGWGGDAWHSARHIFPHSSESRKTKVILQDCIPLNNQWLCLFHPSYYKSCRVYFVCLVYVFFLSATGFISFNLHVKTILVRL